MNVASIDQNQAAQKVIHTVHFSETLNTKTTIKLKSFGISWMKMCGWFISSSKH